MTLKPLVSIILNLNIHYTAGNKVKLFLILLFGVIEMNAVFSADVSEICIYTYYHVYRQASIKKYFKLTTKIKKMKTNYV